ncbi:50S ribosomal protein L6 [bacterium]|nr:50S ribosomal protein L6 [bacterium]
MSRIGLQPITIEDGVEVKIDGSIVTVKGSLGEITVTLPDNLSISMEEKEIKLAVKDNTKQANSNHGTYRMLINNAIYGVKNGYQKTLELVGVGYRARMEGANLVLNVGWNHPITVEPYEGITIEVPDETKVIIKGYDKQKVGQFAAKVRELRKPEPYKGKGIRYEGEYVRRKNPKASIAGSK